MSIINTKYDFCLKKDFVLMMDIPLSVTSSGATTGDQEDFSFSVAIVEYLAGVQPLISKIVHIDLNQRTTEMLIVERK